MLEVIEKKIKTAEEHIENNAINQLDETIASKLKSDLLAYSRIQNFSEEQMKEFESRIDKIEKAVGEYKNSKNSPAQSTQKYLKVPQEKLGTVKTNSFKGLTAGAMLSFGIMVFIGCNGSKNTVEPTEQVVEATTETEMSEIKEEPATMSEEMKAFSDTTIEAVNDALEAGINLSINEELTEADKETYAKTLTQYRIVANMDELTNLEYAELFGEMSNPTEDLINGYNAYNEKIWEHLLTVKSDNMLDYSNLYDNAKDAEVLNESERLIASINDAKDSEAKLEASKAWYSYVINILTSNEGNMALSSQALDTLITHSEAYDELTRSNYYNVQGAYVDDELEHKFNVAKNVCLVKANSESETNINVEDITISNLQSEFRISMKNELQKKYDDALTERKLQLTLGNLLNKYNSFAEVVDYVESKIDLTRYVKLEVNHIEKQYEEKETNAPAQKSKDDSGISNGQTGATAGNISKSDMAQYGATTREEYEQAVINTTNAQSEASKVVTDEKGQTLEGTTEDNQKGFQDGYAAGNSGQPYVVPSGNASYNKGYNNGYNAGKADYDALISTMNNSQTQEYVPVENGESTYTESEEQYQDYTEQITNTNGNVEYNTTFEPVEGYSMDNYDTETTTTFVPIDQASAFSVESELQALRNMRDTLLSASLEEENSKTLS